jgi:hypothetical protein
MMSGYPKRTSARLSSDSMASIERDIRRRREIEDRRQREAAIRAKIEGLRKALYVSEADSVSPAFVNERTLLRNELRELERVAFISNLKATESSLADIGSRVEAYERRLQGQKAERMRLKRQAEESLASLKSSVCGDEFDKVASYWFPEDCDRLRESFGRIERMIDEGRFADAASEAASSLNRAQTLIDKALKQDEQELGRKKIIEAMIGSMEQMGFVLVGQPAYQSSHRDSGVELVGQLPSRQRITAVVYLDGRVEYLTQGFEILRFEGPDGKEQTTCDNAEQVLTDLQRCMDSSHQIVMAEPDWDGKGPTSPGLVITSHGDAQREGSQTSGR